MNTLSPLLPRYRYPTMLLHNTRYQVSVYYRMTHTSEIFEYQSPIEATSRMKAIKSAQDALIESTPEAVIIHSDTIP